MARRHGSVADSSGRATPAAAGDDARPVRACPLRTCIVTRQEAHPDALIRFVLDPAGGVVADLGRKLPGRGVWVGLDRRRVNEAVSRKAFHRAFRREVTTTDDLALRVEEMLARRTCEALSIANKAGLVTTGFESVNRGIEAPSVTCLLHASDAAADGCERLDRKFRAISRDRGTSGLVFTPLTMDQLSLAIGRSTVVHALIGTGRAGDNFVRAAERLIRYRSGAVQSLRNEQAGTGDVRHEASEGFHGDG